MREIKMRDNSRYEKDTQKIHLFDLDLMLTLTSYENDEPEIYYETYGT